MLNDVFPFLFWIYTVVLSTTVSNNIYNILENNIFNIRDNAYETKISFIRELT